MTALVNGSGVVVERYIYTPYGVITVLNASWSTLSGSVYSWVYGFQGMRYDPTSGLYESLGRRHSPTLQRWISIDPLRYGAGDADLYRFVGNGPIDRTDPSGLEPPSIKELPPAQDPPVPVATSNQGKLPPIDWAKAERIGENYFLMGGGCGTAYKLEIGKDKDGKPIIIIFLKPYLVQESRLLYDCNGLTFSGGTSTPEGASVPLILSHYYKEIQPGDKIQAGDILVLFGANGIVMHSCIIIEPMYDSDGNFDPSRTRVHTKNGNAEQKTPETPMTLDQMSRFYKGAKSGIYYTRK